MCSDRIQTISLLSHVSLVRANSKETERAPQSNRENNHKSTSKQYALLDTIKSIIIISKIENERGFDCLVKETNSTAAFMVVMFNSFPRKRRRGFCFFLWPTISGLSTQHTQSILKDGGPFNCSISLFLAYSAINNNS